MDGIERAPGIHETELITPYRAYGQQSTKYQLLLNLISKRPGNIEFERFLTPSELCQLHKMISSSMEPYERGDESRTCPLNILSLQPNPGSPTILRNK